MPKRRVPRKQSRYQALIEKIFFDHYKKGANEVRFVRTEFEAAAKQLRIKLPKNLGDAVYAMRYRAPLPERLIALQTIGHEWIIDGIARGQYAFRLTKISRVVPNPDLITIKVPDATPELISAHALSDEQALLAKVRYNRLIDIFLGIASYSLQNHLRTALKSGVQIEIDEVYVGVDRLGRQFVIPVQAKGGNDQLSPVQAKQDISCCAEKFPTLICRAVSAQFMADQRIALFELTLENGAVKVVSEVHYRLVPAEQITAEDLASYSVRKT
ncbi:MAG TPA: hypothetical protein VGM64_01005 [Lacunisphaera sp.]|jgi:hypothetical protein